MSRAVLVFVLLGVLVFLPFSTIAGRIGQRAVPEGNVFVVTGTAGIKGAVGDPFAPEAPQVLFVFWTEDVTPSGEENYVDTWCTEFPSPILLTKFNTSSLVWNITVKFFSPIYRSRYVALAQCDGSAWHDEGELRLDAVVWSGSIGGLLPYRYELVVEPANVSTANYTLVAQLFKPITALFDVTKCPASTPPSLTWRFWLNGSEISVSPNFAYGFSLSSDARNMTIAISIAFPQGDYGKSLDRVTLDAEYCGVVWRALDLSFANPITLGNTTGTYGGIRIIVTYSFTG